MARANTPTTPAILATTAPVGAGAPPVEVALDERAAEAEAEAEEEAALSRELTEAPMELALAPS